MTPCDPVTLEIIRGAARAAQAEMEALLERTAMSAFIREKKDFYTAIFDAEGAMAVGSDLPIFGDIVGPVLQRYPLDDMRPGDLYWYNDCYGSRGAVSHSNDQVFLVPVFLGGTASDDGGAQGHPATPGITGAAGRGCLDRPRRGPVRIGFVMGWAHFSDIGGLRPGSLSPEATDHFQEGIIIPPVRLQRDGRTNEDLLRTFWRNSRFPTQSEGDTRALMAAVRLGEARLAEIAARFGAEVLADAFAQLLARTESIVRAKLKATFPVGTTRFADAIDSDGQGNGPFVLRLALTRTEEGRFILDATETDDQAPGPVNLLMHPDVPGMALGLYFLQGEAGQVLNAGGPRAIDEVRLREGSLLWPRSPGPLGLRGLTMMRLLAALHGLVAVARHGEAPASHSAYVILALRGEHQGRRFLMTDGVAVGYGARPFADGVDAVYFVAQENYPVEFMELSYPVRLRAYGIQRDSGGAGRWRGGCGVVREYEVLADTAQVAVRIDSVRNPPWGVAGGLNGGSGRAVVNPGTPQERVLPALSDGTVLRRGDVLRLETGGGGGWGHPFDRPAEEVLADVLGGFVSPEAAARDYGLAIQDGAVDAAHTAALRAARGEAKLFHRRGYTDAVV
ncbi:hydantoinase B/oxoprolinase family protein [Roseicella aerolata]|uniref:Hydantoinase B/oxoprolinase family protein n=1 Tax=Roseicella aerolata TaxID=2883479 RepID=A0A9X1II97_9PROT|nr:hydantoinase B/oxoprolinase family protein [Roseicella aerolata]MCB4824579.1 hydantoinase B/oxoprolinase family protein [Roseicella aerolata]